MREDEAEEKALAEESENPGGASARKTRAATFVNRNLSIPHSLKVIEDPFVVAAGMLFFVLFFVFFLFCLIFLISLLFLLFFFLYC